MEHFDAVKSMRIRKTFELNAEDNTEDAIGKDKQMFTLLPDIRFQHLAPKIGQHPDFYQTKFLI